MLVLFIVYVHGIEFARIAAHCSHVAYALNNLHVCYPKADRIEGWVL